MKPTDAARPAWPQIERGSASATATDSMRSGSIRQTFGATGA